MFGFSLTKLLLLAAIVAAVWYGFKILSRRNEAAEVARDESRRDSARRHSGPAEETKGIDMVYDPESDSYVPRGGQRRDGTRR